jgi:hypothetical protein
MSVSEIQEMVNEAISSIEYKENWRFSHDSNNLYVETIVPSIHNPDVEVTIRVDQKFDDLRPEPCFIKGVIFSMILQIEGHEILEFLKFNGENFEPPHTSKNSFHTAFSPARIGLPIQTITLH